MRAAAAAVLAFLLLCTSGPSSAGELAGLLWKADLAGRRIYLYGVSHLAPQRLSFLPSHVRKALSESEVLITEFNVGEMVAAPEQLRNTRRSYAATSFELTPEVRERLGSLQRDGWLTEKDVTALLGNSPLSAARTISAAFARARVAKGRESAALNERLAKGQDAIVLEVSKNTRKQIVQLENTANPYLFWIERCESMANNSAFIDGELDAALDDQEFSDRVVRQHELVAQGDIDQLIRMQVASAARFPSTRLFIECQQPSRNEHWVDRLGAIVNKHQAQTFFLAAGASHFLPFPAEGQNSLLDLLAKHGYAITRIYPD